jgi:hypothetical protein
MLPFFKKKPEDNVWYEFLHELYTYCDDQDDHVSINCSLYDDRIEMVSTSYPYYYQVETYIEELETLGYSNFYEVLDVLFEKTKINRINFEQVLKEESQYFFWRIKIPIRFDRNWTYLYIYVFFVTEVTNRRSYRISYHYAEYESLQAIAENTDFFVGDLKDPLEYEKEITQHFLNAVVALAQQLNIKIPTDLKAMFPEPILEMPPCKEDFKQIIELVNYHPFDQDIEEIASQLYEDLLAELPKISGEYSFWNHTETLSYNHYKIMNFDNVWSSDWKFDPEDPRYFIRDILGEDWPFEYPEETYSNNLFPYIQDGLGKIGLALMGLATYGDCYEFFVVKKENVAKILKLSKKICLEIEYYES